MDYRDQGSLRGYEDIEYIDLDLNIPILIVSNYPEISDYYIIVTAITATDILTQIPTIDYKELNKMQQSSYRFKLETYKHREHKAAKIKVKI